MSNELITVQVPAGSLIIPPYHITPPGPKVFVGVDLGKEGFICKMYPDERGIVLTPMPKIGKEVDYNGLSDLFRELVGKGVQVVFERLQATPMVPKHTCISMGWQAGMVEGICVSFKLPYVMVTPKVWQKVMFGGVPDMKKGEKRDTKGMALIAASRLFPGVDFRKNDRCKVPDNNAVDSLLLAEYARRNY